MTQAELRTLFRELTTELNTTVVPNATIDLYLDSGIQALNRRVKYYFVDNASGITLVAGTQEYTAPTDFLEMVWIELNGVKLVKSSVNEWENAKIDWRNADSGTPREWAIYGNKIIVYPKPNAAAVTDDATCTIRYIATPSIDATGPLLLATQDHKLVVYFAVAEWSFAHPDSEAALQRAQNFMQVFEREAQGVIEFYKRRRFGEKEEG